MKHLLKFMTGVFSILMLTSMTVMATGWDTMPVLGGITAMSVGVSLAGLPQGSFYAVALLELWEQELIRNFRFENTWMARVPSRDNYVNNDVIHIHDFLNDPDVLIDNQVYPIPIQDLPSDDHPVSLNKFQTKATPITDDELYGIPFDKEGAAIRQHREALEEKTAEFGLHNIAPSADAAGTPIVQTTGADNGNGRKRLAVADVIKLKKKFDELKVPRQNRILVLCSDHVEDLLLTSEVFRDQYKDIRTGQVLNLFGFEIFESVYNPVYDNSIVKKAYGAAAASSDHNASVAFYTGRTFKARGGVKMYHSLAAEDPQNQRSLLNFRLYFTAMALVNGYGAIVSADSNYP